MSNEAGTHRILQVEHVLQPALLCRDLDATMDFLHRLLGIYPSERVRIEFAGVNNAVYAFEDMTFLELIEPYDETAPAGRLLERYGNGWHMLSVDLVDRDPERVAARLEELHIHFTHREMSGQVNAAFHLHPRNAEGVLLLLALRADHDDNGAYAGPAWREYVATNTRVVHSILGVSLVTDDLARTVERYRELGFWLGEPWQDDGDTVLQADCLRGSFLQVRSPGSADSPSATMLERRGPGLFHLIFAAPHLDQVRRALAEAGGEIDRETEVAGRPALWTRPESTLGVPIEFRRR